MGVKILTKAMDIGGKLQGKTGEEARSVLSKSLLAVELHPKLAPYIGELTKVSY
jgi:hypothetical protein